MAHPLRPLALIFIQIFSDNHKMIRLSGDILKLDAFDAVSLSIVITNATLVDNPIVYANAAFLTLCGYGMEEVIGRNCRFLQGPDTDRLAAADIRAAIAAGTSIHREILNYRKDGTPFWNDLRLDPIRDTSGLLTGFIGVQQPADAIHFAFEKN